ncbi:MAG: hypothetical protein V1934_01220 [Methanobacteriota archaeon]
MHRRKRITFLTYICFGARKRFAFLKSQSLESKGWLNDVLACVRELPHEFALADAYGFEAKLARLHPGNRRVKPKIRQQLQVLQDNHVLEFVSPGKYRKIA